MIYIQSGRLDFFLIASAQSPFYEGICKNRVVSVYYKNHVMPCHIEFSGYSEHSASTFALICLNCLVSLTWEMGYVLGVQDISKVTLSLTLHSHIPHSRFRNPGPPLLHNHPPQSLK